MGYGYIDRAIERGMSHYWNKEKDEQDGEDFDAYECRLRKQYWGYWALYWADQIWTPIQKVTDGIYYWFLYRFVPKHRYHVVRPRTLKLGYHEQGTRLFHAAFEMLSSFIEEQACYNLKKKGIELKNATKDQIINSFYSTNCDKDRDESTYKRGNHPFGLFGKTDREIVNLYWWWTKDRIDPENAWDQFKMPEISPKFGCMFSEESKKKYPEYYEYLDNCSKLEEELQEKDKEMLVRLAAIAYVLSV